LRYDEIFAALPPLDSQAYREHINHAPKSELPAEVLVRAFHILSQAGPHNAAEATLGRLFGQKDGRPEYMLWLLREARKCVPFAQLGYDADDLYSEALDQIARALVRPSGKKAHTGWIGFCRHRLIDAWRAHLGTKAEQNRPDKPIPRTVDPNTGFPIDLLEPSLNEMDWFGTVASDQEEKLFAYLRNHVEQISCELTRTVTIALHFSTVKMNVSGTAPPDGPLPLTEQLGRSRDQINRAKAKGEAVIRAAIQQWRMEIDQ
jgi:hypothetical protein